MDEGVWEAARAVRPYLAEFFDPKEAAEVDAKLAGLLARAAAGEDVEDLLRVEFDARLATSVFLERVLDDPDLLPPGVRFTLKSGYAHLPGDRLPVPPRKFRCPHPDHDYVWYQPGVGVQIPKCPTHHCTIVPVPEE